MARKKTVKKTPKSKNVSVEETPASEVETEEENTTPEPVQLTLQDMQAVAQILDVATRRGAFQAKEMTAVGAVYDKLNGFLEYIASTQESDEEQEAVEE